ncbi:hypothetical protein AB0F43_20905 [Kribbella sp. NPDC023972]|uniref:hypothetical protein n=1 Tax=Kribbella sp. NPDC023972 TaxID=3154795 RepID=UPI0033C7192A
MLDFVETEPAPSRADVIDRSRRGEITADRWSSSSSRSIWDQPPAVSSLDARPKRKAKYLWVMVDSLGNGDPGRVNVRVPLELPRAGVRLAVLIPAPALEQANAELNKSGVPLDLTQLKP